MSVINEATEAVMDLIDAALPEGWSGCVRGALGTQQGIGVAIAPSSPDEVYLDKAVYIPLDLTLNGKSDDLQALTNAMNDIHHELTTKTTYPTGSGWHIVDIRNYTMPQEVGRENEGGWLVASSLAVMLYIE